MAKGRMLNHSITLSLKFDALPDDTCRLLATWTISRLDFNGVFYGDPAAVKSLIFPLRSDVSLERIEAYLQAIHSAGLVVLFTANGRRWQWWPGFTDNQIGLRRDREASDFPLPPDEPQETSPQDDSDEDADSRQVAAKLPPDCRQDDATNAAEEKVRESKLKETNTLSQQAQSIQESTHPAIALYIKETGELPNDTQKELIHAAIEDLDKWKHVITDWKAHKTWHLTNVPGMIDSYRSFGKSKQRGYSSNGNGAQRPRKGVSVRQQVDEPTETEIERSRAAARARIAQRAAARAEQSGKA